MEYKMAYSVFIIVLLYPCQFISATSWTSKEKERGFKIETAQKGKSFDWTKIGDTCKDDHPGCKEFVGQCGKLKIIRKKCRETCGLCRAWAPPDCKVSKYGCCWDNTTIATGPYNEGCPACSDQYSECKYFSVHCSRADIKTMCPVTCGVKCKQCLDNRHQAKICPLYKKFKFCDISPDLMEKMCAKTCGFCPS